MGRMDKDSHELGRRELCIDSAVLVGSFPVYTLYAGVETISKGKPAHTTPRCCAHAE